MDFFQIFILTIVQGLTEFLPISSSGHLILVPELTGWTDQGLAFDVAVHVGSLLAVIGYFYKDVWNMAQAWLHSVVFRQMSPDARLAWAVALGTIPAGLAGLLLGDFIEANLRSALTIATTTIIFGLLLWWADVFGARQRDEYTLSWKDVFIIGCAQAIALIPGTSRSGITITAALMLGLTRNAAARFSFLLSIPVILLSGGLKTKELIASNMLVDWSALGFGVILSALSAYLCIHIFLKLIDRIGMLPFVIYRLALGALLFWWFL